MRGHTYEFWLWVLFLRCFFLSVDEEGVFRKCTDLYLTVQPSLTLEKICGGIVSVEPSPVETLVLDNIMAKAFMGGG